MALGEEKEVEVVLTSTSGDIRTYTIHASRKEYTDAHSSKLSRLYIENYDKMLTPKFDSEIYEYTLELNPGEIDLSIITETYDENAEVVIEGDKYLYPNTGAITITVTAPEVEDTVYTITYTKASVENNYQYDYTGEYQTFIAPITGSYTFELWGAQGGTGYYSTQPTPGKGGYTKGTITLEKGTKFYIYVGGQGQNASGVSINPKGGWNGGGDGRKSSDNDDCGSGGGGATDIRTVRVADYYDITDTKDLSSLSSRIMVAAGGGGAHSTSTTNYTEGMNAGGLKVSGMLSTWTGTWTPNVTQTTGYAFGIGQTGESVAHGGSGAGGGYYGGQNQVISNLSGRASGGSSYISGHNGSIAISADSDLTPRKDSENNDCIDNTTDVTCSYHYSGYVFKNTQMIDGTGYEWSTERMTDKVINQPTYNGSSTQTGNSGNGYAKVTPIILSEDNYLTSLSTDKAQTNETFTPTSLDYTVTLDKYDQEFTVEATKSNENAIMTGLETYEIAEGETKEVTVNVTSESGNLKTYTLTVTRPKVEEEHTSKLKVLDVENYEKEISPAFHPLTNDYTLNIHSGDIRLNILTESYDSDATIEITGNEYMTSNTGVITITVTAPEVEDTIYTITYTKVDTVLNISKYDYTGEYQTFIAPRTGFYKIELWGAQGGNYNSSYVGGKGAYTQGTIRLNKNDLLYVYVGSQGDGFNSGGTGNGNGKTGGGSTDIRLVRESKFHNTTVWTDPESLASRIMVAAGGAGAAYNGTGKAAGGLIGYAGTSSAGATQTTGGTGNMPGSFGIPASSNANGASGAGGGYYGGGTQTSSNYLASSGSSYISGHVGSVAIKSASDRTPIDNCETGTDNILCSMHYSGYSFIDTLMIDGQGYKWTTEKYTNVPVMQPTKDGLSTQDGNTGNGYAKITPINLSEDNYLTDLTTNRGTINEEFDPVKQNYTLTLGAMDENFTLSGTLSDNKSIVSGLDTVYRVEQGETKAFNISVTNQIGDVRIYTVEVTRPSVPNEHTSKLSKLEVVSYEDSLEPIFHPLEYNYSLQIHGGEIDLNVIAEAYDEDATIEISKTTYLTSDTGVITITVSAPEVEDTIYTINYEKQNALLKTNEYSLTHDYQTFIAPDTSYYKFEVWGAGAPFASGGNGGYSSGIMKVNKGEIFYVYVGGAGKTGSGTNAYGGPLGGYNGGGNGGNSASVSGAGATDIRLKNGKWDNSISLASRIMVAGGAGGADDGYTSASNDGRGGAGGGLESQGSWIASSYNAGYKATQTTGYAFGIGGSVTTNDDAGGAGGGYWGGKNPSHYNGAGGGGSGYVSGHPGAVAITSEDDLSPRLDSEGNTCADGTNDVICSHHYSDKVFMYTVMKSGNESMPTYDGDNTMTGNYSDGHAKISQVIISDDNYIKELDLNSGVQISPSFDPETLEYDITLSEYNNVLVLNGTLSNENASVINLNETYEFEPEEEKTIDVIVTSESGKVRTYTFNVRRPSLSGEHSSLLYKLQAPNYPNDLTPIFDGLTYEYSLEIFGSDIDLDLTYTPFDSEATVKIEGNRYMSETTGDITITVSAPEVEDTVYTIHYTKIMNLVATDYSCTKQYQEFTATVTGRYDFELWGASGGQTLYNGAYRGYLGGAGGYTKGSLQMNAGDTVYIYVGCMGGNGIRGGYAAGGWNGGGSADNDHSDDEAAGAGGGATDVRLVPTSAKGIWNEFDSLKSRIMVAGAGGGASDVYWGAAAGGLTGYNGGHSTGGSQTAPGRNSINTGRVAGFGYGLKGTYTYGNKDESGGGSGYYGGGAGSSNGDYYSQSAGGSSFISGHEGSNAILESSLSTAIAHSGQSIHYSGKYFIDTKMVDGAGYEWTTERAATATGMPTIDGTSTENGHRGDGHAKVTPSSKSKDNYLSNLWTDKGILSPEFDKMKLDYTIELGEDDTELYIYARPSDDGATIDGLGKHMIEAGINEIPINVTSEYGEIKTYTITVSRPASSEARAKNITITGLLESVCGGHLGYCQIDEEFDPDVDTYYMTVPSGIREIEFTVDKMHYYQTVVGAGVTKLEPEDNTISIEVTSEDGQEVMVYNYEIYRDMTGDNYIDELTVSTPDKVVDGEVIEGDLIDIGFNYLLTEYSFRVPNEVENLKLDIKLDDPDATYVIEGNSNFKVGNNVVDIQVTAQNGEVKDYILNVYRVSNANTLLKTLTVVNGSNSYTLSPEFSDIVTSYAVNVENEISTVTINATAQATTTRITGTGAKALSTGPNEFNIVTTAENGDIETYRVIVTRAKSANNYIKSLSISEGAVSPAFNKNTQDYTMTVNPYVKKLTITPTLDDSAAKYAIKGNANFKIGENTVTITVTAENGETRDYNIVVTKQGSDINFLKSLSVSQGTLKPAFNKDKDSYTLEVSDGVSQINITGEMEDTLSTVTGFGNYKLVKGANTISINVTSETGITRTYTVVVNRQYNGDATLKDITISSGTLEFADDKMDYEVNVASDINEITIGATPTQKTTTVSGTGIFSVDAGENNFELITTAEDGTNLRYTIKVIRDKSSNANLSSLLVREGILRPSFDKMTVSYETKVPYDVEEVHIDALPEDAGATISYQGLNNLEVGNNTVKVIVTASDLTQKEYSINVIRQPEAQNSLDLKTLDVTSCTLEFDPSIQYYECEVENEVDKVTVTATLDDEINNLQGTGDYDLEVGRNEIGLKVINPQNIEKDYQVVITRKKSKESRLKNIKVEGHSLNEAFDKDIYEYTLTTQEKNLSIKYEKLHDDEKVLVTGNRNLTLGENVITITSESPDGTRKSTYHITATKEANENNYLKSLGVEGYNITPEFSKGVSGYDLTVENEVNSIVIDATAEYEDAVITGAGMTTLEVGENEIPITVTSESGEDRVYTLYVTRNPSSNNYLKELSVSRYSFDSAFDKYTQTYTLGVSYAVDKLDINATPEDRGATVVGSGTVNLTKGVNRLPITVTAEDGSVRTYTIVVKRVMIVTSKLWNIEAKGYSLDQAFDPDITDYNITVENEVTSLDLIVTKMDPNSNYVIKGNSDFKVGLNKIQVISTSSDEIEKTTYTLTVNRQSYSNTYLRTLATSYGILEPEFDKTIMDYRVDVPTDVDSITIEGSPDSSGSTVTGFGTFNLNLGKNVFKIVVTSKGGIIRTYTVTVNRQTNDNANVETVTSPLGNVAALGKTDYQLILTVGRRYLYSSDIIVTPEDPGATVEKTESLNLSESKEYKFTVTSVDGTKTVEYTINILSSLNGDETLRSIETSDGTLSPEFKPDILEYTLDVFDDLEEVEIIGTPNDELANMLNTDNIYQLENDETSVSLIVEAQDGTIKIYKVNVVKSLTKKRQPANIELTGITDKCADCTVPEFGETTYRYDLVVPYDVDSFNFNVTKKHNAQEVKIYKDNNLVTSYPLSVGVNTYYVRVKNSLNEETTYTYNIERLKNTNNNLRELSLTSPQITLEDFDPSKLEYSILVPYEYENVTVKAIPEDELNAIVRISGATYLQEGINDIKIKVIAHNGDEKTYIIHATRVPGSNDLLKTLTVATGDIYDLTPKFIPGITNYSLTLPSSIDKVKVEGLAADDEAQVEGNGEYDLRVGLNNVTIKVISKNLTEREYNIAITRESNRVVYLKTLDILNGDLIGQFEKTKGTYTVSLPYTEDRLNMNIETEDPNASYEIYGNENLRFGTNEVKIKVTSSDGSAAKTYVLNVVKEGNINNNLSTLTIDGNEVEGFDPNITHYTYTVENKVDHVVIGAEGEDSTSSITGIGYYSLMEGENKINVNVISQSGKIKTYTITVTRKENAYLLTLVTDRGEFTPTFDRDTFNYEMTVENEIEDITVIGIKESASSTVAGNGKYALNVGDNIITITVINGSNRNEYVLKVTRKGSTNTYLKYLTIAEGILSPEFDKETQEYTIYIPEDKNKLSLNYETEDPTSSVTEIGNENITEKESVVTLRVTSTSGQYSDYILNVVKDDLSEFSNKLLDLTVEEGSLSPKFDPDINEYTVTVGSAVNQVNINVIRESKEATVDGVGVHKVKSGRNVIPVTVTSRDGKDRVYTVIVYKSTSKDARIEKLEFNEGYLSPAFNKNVYNYTLVTDSDAALVSIKELELVDPSATYEITGNSAAKTGNVLNIKVTSQDGSVSKTYKMTIKLEQSSNAYLKEIYTNVGQLNPEFSKTKYSYTINVGKDVNDIIVTGIAESSKAIVDGNARYPLHSGDNYINLIVTSEKGTTNTYSLLVTKERSDNANLKDLFVRGYLFDQAFDPEETHYTLTVENEIDSVYIDAIVDDSNATLTGTGQKDLKVGDNNYDVIVVGEDGTSKVYTVTITRQSVISSKIDKLYVKEGVLTPIFTPNTLEYNVTIPNEYDKITPVVSLVEETASYEVIGNEELQVGRNVVEIKVTSSSGEETTYKLNVIRSISTNNYLKSLSTDKGVLSPEFDKTVMSYTMEVENDVEFITVSAEAETSSTTVTGNRKYGLLVGENVLVVKATSESGIERNYQIRVTRKAKDNNYLSSLTSNVGSLSPVFDKEIQEYTLNVPEGTKNATISGTPEDETASVIGFSTYELKVGENKVDIMVTAENGDIRTYEVNIVRPISSNTNVINITPSSSTLEPEFDNSISSYQITVPSDVNIINFDVELESNVAKVSGNTNIPIDVMREAEILVTAEDGTQRIIKVKLNREVSITDIELKDKNVTLIKGDSYQIVPTAVPENSSDNFVYRSEDEQVASVDENGLVKANSVGSVIIKVTTPDNPLIEKEMQVNVLHDEIVSDEYGVRDNEQKIVIGAEIETTIREFKLNLLNDSRTINIYDLDGNIVEDDEIVKTGLIIKLEYNDKTYDEATMVVRGDVDGDGYVNVTDYITVLNHALEVDDIVDYAKFAAADVEEDEMINVTDYIKIMDYSLENLDSLN